MQGLKIAYYQLIREYRNLEFLALFLSIATVGNTPKFCNDYFVMTAILLQNATHVY